MTSQSRVTVLVKAYPQPSKSHQETVCCAGIDENGNWKRLFPVRFRQLSGDQAFSRWDILDFQYSRPTSDTRIESCRVHEESISIVGKVKSSTARGELVEKVLVSSEREAAELGQSLALIRPGEPELTWKKKSADEITAAKEAFSRHAQQGSFLDKELEELEPCPYTFKMKYRDGGGPHTKTCADWETSAAFWNISKGYDEKTALDHLRTTYIEEYSKRGLVFALGNIARRPQIWQLLGIFPAIQPAQLSLVL